MSRMDECSPRGIVKLHSVCLRAAALDIYFGAISSRTSLIFVPHLLSSSSVRPQISYLISGNPEVTFN
jgi:hypothetical protein